MSVANKQRWYESNFRVSTKIISASTSNELIDRILESMFDLCKGKAVVRGVILFLGCRRRHKIAFFNSLVQL